MKPYVLFVFLLTSYFVSGQSTQPLRGTVTDQVLKEPLAGATLVLEPGHRTAVTNEEGVFRFDDVSVGTYRILVTYLGYKEVLLDNIAVNAGKEPVLTISLEALVKTESEIVLRADSKKNKPLNDLSVVSARAFTVEETQRYAASVNDPLRMAAAFPGVMANDDGNNNIIIRGNSPTGLLWRMEGMDIPSPNHFSQPGLSGGGISILSSQLLANSDFVTSAFAAEYGNALSGAFDLRLRKGNNEKREYALQVGVLGLNAAAEGPFAKNYKGSYLINYRYSTLSLLSKVGVLPNDNTTNFQDLSYNISLPTNRLGQFTLFGFAGRSDQYFNPDPDSAKWEGKSDRYQSVFVSNTSMNGLTHSLALGKKMKWVSGIGISHTKLAYDEHFTEDDLSLRQTYLDEYKTRNLLFNTALYYKVSRKWNLRAGFINKEIRYRFFRVSADHDDEPLEELLNTTGNTATRQAYTQAQFRPSNTVSIQAGLHYLTLSHNRSKSVEPRASVRWSLSPRSVLSAGYGLHSQVQTLNVYFAQQEKPGGGYSLPNRDLGFTRAHHGVLSYSYRVARNTQLKAELYYQHLFDVPVATSDSSTISTLNVEYEYVTDPLVNKGKGRNYGMEISVERYLQDNFYLTLSNSLYQSKYTAADGIERNTRFNGGYIFTLITGKDFVSDRKQKTVGVNLKTIYAGGLRTTPIDLAASQQAGHTVYREKEAFSEQNPAYFRTDLRVSIKWNRKKVTSTLSLDIQNLTNRLNLFSRYYNEEKNKIENFYQTGLVPVLNYKIEF